MSDLVLTTEQGIYYSKAKTAMEGIAKNSLVLGQTLVAAKKHLVYGEFIPLLKALNLEARTAQRYMSLTTLGVVSNTTNLSLLINFNNSQLKKLDEMKAEEAQIIIESGEFPKDETKAPVHITGEVVPKEETVESLRRQLELSNKLLEEEMNSRVDANDMAFQLNYYADANLKLEDRNRELEAKMNSRVKPLTGSMERLNNYRISKESVPEVTGASMMVLHCGDCNDIIDDLDFDVIVTDPPFNIGYSYNTYHDRLEEDAYYDMLVNVIKDKPCVIIHYAEQLHKLSIKLGEAPEKVVSWVYNSNTGKQHRQIAFYGIKPDFTQVGQPYKNTEDKRIAKRIEDGKEAKLYDWWNINQVKNISFEKLDHPCQMPLEVMNNIIGILPKDMTVLDPFLGTGTTGVACKNLGRNFIGIEQDKEYFRTAKDRIYSNIHYKK